MIKFTDKFTPMLLKEVYKPFNDKEYLYEVKFDGIRALIYVNSKVFKIMSRNNEDLTSLFPELKDIQKLITKDTIFDGEIVLMDHNKPSFSSLQGRIHLKNKSRIETLSKENPVTYIAFDCLYFDRDLTEEPLIKRKEYLNRFKDTDYFVKSKVFSDGIKLFEKVKQKDLEGVVAKLKNSEYEINKRCDNWVKIKNMKSEYFNVLGYIQNENSTVSLLLLDKNKYIGKVTLSKRHKYYKELLKKKKIKNSKYNIKGAIYIEEGLSVKVLYLEKTKDGSLREGVIR